jgi:hypothetical protein
MALTFLILPMVLLKANLIVSIGLEKMDMWFNIISFVFNIMGCLIGLYFFKSLTVINYSIFISFAIFHVLQDILLIWKKYTNIQHSLLFYSLSAVLVLSYQYLNGLINPYIGFVIFCFIIIFSYVVILLSDQKNKEVLSAFSTLFKNKINSIT